MVALSNDDMPPRRPPGLFLSCGVRDGTKAGALPRPLRHTPRLKPAPPVALCQLLFLPVGLTQLTCCGLVFVVG